MAGNRTEPAIVFKQTLEANRKAIAEGADGLLFMQNAAIHAVRGESRDALE